MAPAAGMAEAAAPAEAPPKRLAALPLPPSLTDSVEESKRRIKLIERILKAHKSKACLEESEFVSLSQELRDLKGVLPPSSGSAAARAEKLRGEVLEEEGAALGETEGSSKKLQIKREIREIEKQVKLHKKKTSFSAQEMVALAARLEALKEQLNELQDWNPVIVRLAGAGPDGSADEAASVAVTSEDRVSIAGLSVAEASELRACFDTAAPAAPAAGRWRLWRHEGLRAAALHSREPQALAQELAGLAQRAPHVICVGTASLRTRGGTCAVLRAFHGALVVIEEDDDSGDRDVVDASCLLHAMGIVSRYRRRPDGSGLEPIEMPLALQGEVIGDLRLRDAKESPVLAPLFAEADELCLREFDEDLTEVLSVDVVRLGLLLSTPPPAPPSAKGKPLPPPLFLGFITYKFWGPPLKAMSISRVAVPKKYQMQGFGRQLVRWAIEKAKQKSRFECDRVSLSAIPKAYNFYERLNFYPVQDDDVPDDGLGQDAVRMEFSLGRSAKR